MSKKRVLIVEDESIVAMDIKSRAENLGYLVTAVVTSGEEAVEKTAELQPDLVLMDIVLKGKMDGIKAAQSIRDRLNIPVVYITAYSDEKTLERAKITGPFGYIIKPFEDRDLHTAIELALYQHKMENQLRESEEKYRYLFEESRDAIVIISKKGKFIDFNNSFAHLLGYTKEELMVHKAAEIFIDPGDWNNFQREMEEKRHVKDYETKLRDKEGEEIVCIISSSIRTREGNDLEYQGIIHDITQRKKAEEALRKSEEKYRRVVERFLKVVSEILKEIKEV